MDEVTITEAARVLGLDESSIRRRIRLGQMRARRLGGRIWLIPGEELQRCRELGRFRPGPPAALTRVPRTIAPRSDAESDAERVSAIANQAQQEDDPEYSTARGLLRFLGTWEGDDIEERLREVYATRSGTRFT